MRPLTQNTAKMLLVGAAGGQHRRAVSTRPARSRVARRKAVPASARYFADLELCNESQNARPYSRLLPKRLCYPKRMTASAYNAITSQLCPKAAALSEKNFSLSEKQTMQYELIIDRRTLRHREPICAMGWPKLRQGVVLSNARARLLSAQFAIGVLAQNSFMARANAMTALIPPQTLAEAAIRHWRNPGIAWRSSRHFADIAAVDLLVYRIRLFSISTEIDTLPPSAQFASVTVSRLKLSNRWKVKEKLLCASVFTSLF